jgi:hypothetical protein
MTNGYLEVISLIERLHRHFLEVVKLELDGLGIHDINNVQGMMLFNIGDAEMTVGELTLRGCYLGSNVSYNVKKLVENGYLVQERSVHTAAQSMYGSPKRGLICVTGSASCTHDMSRCWARPRSPIPICKASPRR